MGRHRTEDQGVVFFGRRIRVIRKLIKKAITLSLFLLSAGISKTLEIMLIGD